MIRYSKTKEELQAMRDERNAPKETGVCTSCGGNAFRPVGSAEWRHYGEMARCLGVEVKGVTGYSFPMRGLK